MKDLWQIAVQMKVLESMEIMLPLTSHIMLEDWAHTTRALHSSVNGGHTEEQQRWSQLL